MLATLITIIDTTIVNVAIPTLGRELKTTLATIQWATTAYILALAVVMPLNRWVVDRVGTKTAFVASLVLFIGGSMLCGLAWSANALIGFRALQGIGGGLLVPVGQTILARSAGPARMGRVMAIVGTPSILGVVIGPVMGGLIVTTLGWRWIFYVNVPLGAVTLLLAVAFFHRDDARSRPPLDLVGLLLISPGLALLLFGFSELGNTGGFSTPVLIGFLGGLVLITVFVVRSLRIELPLINLRLFANSHFRTANLASFAYIAAIGSNGLLSTLYFQDGRGYSALGSGLFQSSNAFGIMATMPFAGRIIDRTGPRRVTIVGVSLTIISVVPWIMLKPTTSTSLLTVSLIVRGLGTGCVTTPLIAAGYAALERSTIPSATTLTNIVQRVGQSIGVAVLALVLQSAIFNDLPGRHRNLDSLPTTAAARRAVLAPLAHAFSTAGWCLLFMCIAPLLFALFLPRRRAPAGEPEEVLRGESSSTPVTAPVDERGLV